MQPANGIPLLLFSWAVKVTEARALYDKHYALQKKEIELTTSAKCDGNKLASLSEKKTKMAVYAEKPAGSRLFLKIKNYRRAH